MRPVAVIRSAIYLFIGLLLLGSTGLALGFLVLFREDTSRFAIRLPIPKEIVVVPYIPVEGELTLGSGVPSQITGN